MYKKKNKQQNLFELTGIKEVSPILLKTISHIL